MERLCGGTLHSAATTENKKQLEAQKGEGEGEGEGEREGLSVHKKRSSTLGRKKRTKERKEER